MLSQHTHMKLIKDNHQGISTFLSFALLPLSGFATDIYIPALPSMASDLSVTNSAVQLSLILFMVSYGISQWFVGSLLDSYGRFRLGTSALLIFALASFTIAATHNIYLIYAMRILQGTTVAMIVVGKRAYFVDVYSGDKLKHYVSLFSIIWATAPIVAPFIGGYLQTVFGWSSNFYFLGIFAMIILVFELIYSGESLKHFQPFKAKTILQVYRTTLTTVDFVLGLVIIAISYAMLVVYGMTSPFIIEHVFHLSPVVTGYCSLLSGVFLMLGGITSKMLIKKDFNKKLGIAIALQAVVAVFMIASSTLVSNLYTLMAFTLVIHYFGGFVFNNVFAYCLGRFTKNAGIASGVTGGSMYIITSILSYGIVNVIPIQSQSLLGVAYLSFSIVLIGAFTLFVRARAREEAQQSLAQAA